MFDPLKKRFEEYATEHFPAVTPKRVFIVFSIMAVLIAVLLGVLSLIVGAKAFLLIIIVIAAWMYGIRTTTNKGVEK
ncbi:hypothetical protein [Sulfuricurvum sp.]|uniref:hypothetical protein n=1 Tax=Sulfuricurvum sp. TaxID=2025608 RepID=UPI0026051A8A|nr:hypothetical protein [Sulfuricurvum sp.]MDD3597595.1 hypothetical protein [Sulfuricurvum sp.]